MKIKAFVVSRKEEPKGNTVAPSSDGNIFAVTLRFRSIYGCFRSIYGTMVTGSGDVTFLVDKADYEQFIPGTEREFELR